MLSAMSVSTQQNQRENYIRIKRKIEISVFVKPKSEVPKSKVPKSRPNFIHLIKSSTNVHSYYCYCDLLLLLLLLLLLFIVYCYCYGYCYWYL